MWLYCVLYFLTFCCKFDSIATATQAKNGLHGQDIYSGCCTIKTEFAKVCPVVNGLGPIFLISNAKFYHSVATDWKEIFAYHIMVL